MTQINKWNEKTETKRKLKGTWTKILETESSPNNSITLWFKKKMQTFCNFPLNVSAALFIFYTISNKNAL